MSPKQVTPWLKVPYLATSWEGALLVMADPAYVPMLLAELEPRKARSLWTSDEQHVIGYDAICKQQEALLLDAVERINRALFYQMGYPRDVTLATDGFPAVELPEATLFAIRTRLGDPGDPTLVSILAAIREELRANGPNGEALGELFTQLAVYLLI